MRLTKLMGLAIAIVALAVTMNALAFKTAVVTNTATFTVQGTDDADTALRFSAATTPGSGFSATEAVGGATQRQWEITVSDKMQPNSTYTFAGVMKITNKNANPVNITDVTATAPGGVTVTLHQTGVATLLEGNTNLLADGAQDVDMKVAVDSTYGGGGGSISIAITAEEP